MLFRCSPLANYDVVLRCFNYGVVITFMIVSHTLHFEMEIMLVEMACIGGFCEGMCW